MSSAELGAIASLVVKEEQSILAEWLDLQKKAGALDTGRINQAELTAQCRDFLRLLCEAKQCGGDVTIRSEIGEGTTVTVLLPRTNGEAVVGVQDDAQIVRSERAEKILIVDDDADVRRFVAGLLSELGYEVREAEHRDAAINTLAVFNPDLLILDFAMPGKKGAETAIDLRAKCPDVPILFVSGFANSEELERATGVAPLLRNRFAQRNSPQRCGPR
jgi:CheY-like chemotaxis protein